MMMLLLASTTTNNKGGGSGGGFVNAQGNSNFLPPAHSYIGRSIKGSTWNVTNQTFDVYYYVKIEYIQGGNNISDCVVNIIDDAFVAIDDETTTTTNDDEDSSIVMIQDITLDPIGMIEWDHGRANASGGSVTGTGGGTGASSDNPAATAITKKKSLVAVEDNAKEIRQIGGTTMMTTTRQQQGGSDRQQQGEDDNDNNMDMEEEQEEEEDLLLIEEEEVEEEFAEEEESEQQQEEEYYYEEENDDDKWREELDYIDTNIDNVREYFHDRVSSFTGGRYGWSYKMETIVGVYLNIEGRGIYMNNFTDIISFLPSRPSPSQVVHDDSMVMNITAMATNISSLSSSTAVPTTEVVAQEEPEGTATTVMMEDDFYVESFKEFVSEELKRLVAVVVNDNNNNDNSPSSPCDDAPFFEEEFFFEQCYYYYNRYPLHLLILTDRIRDCVQGLEGDYGIDPNQENSTIVGRSITGEWNGVEYEILSYVEIFSILGVNDDTIKECFDTSLDSLFIDPYVDTTTDGNFTMFIDEMTLQQKNIARSIGEQEEMYRNTLNFTELQEDSSIYSGYSDGGAGWTTSFSGGGGYSLSSERGVAVFLDGTYVRSFEDVPPTVGGFDVFVKDALQNVLNSDVTGLFPSDSNYNNEEIPFLEERGRSIYIFLIPELLNNCIETTTTNDADASSMSEGFNSTPGDGLDDADEDSDENANGDDPDSVVNRDGTYYCNAWISTTVVATATLMWLLLVS